MKTIAFIPIRSGSKSIIHKNVKKFCGKPLVYWATKACNDSDEIDEVYVATDSEYYQNIIESFNLPKVKVYRRSYENAQDNSNTEDVMLEWINKQDLSDNDIFVLVQCTSPYTTSEDFNKALSLYKIGSKWDSMLSASTFKRFFWNQYDEQGCNLPINYNVFHRPLRQQWQGSLLENGSFYISTVGSIKKFKCRLSGNIRVYEMPEWTQYEIDEESDWEILESVFYHKVLKYQKEQKNIKLVFMDIDGCLTDGNIWINKHGEEIYCFSKKDSEGIRQLKEKDIKVAFITSEKSIESYSIFKRRIQKMNADYFIHGEENKLSIVQSICKNEQVSLEEVAGIGDDIVDIEFLEKIGYAVCPKNAHVKVRNLHNVHILENDSTQPVIREFCDKILDMLPD